MPKPDDTNADHISSDYSRQVTTSNCCNKNGNSKKRNHQRHHYPSLQWCNFSPSSQHVYRPHSDALYWIVCRYCGIRRNCSTTRDVPTYLRHRRRLRHEEGLLTAAAPLDGASTEFVRQVAMLCHIESNTAMPHVSFVEGLPQSLSSSCCWNLPLQRLCAAVALNPTLRVRKLHKVRRKDGVHDVLIANVDVDPAVAAAIQQVVASGPANSATIIPSTPPGCLLPQFPTHISLGAVRRAGKQATMALKAARLRLRGVILRVDASRFRLLGPASKLPIKCDNQHIDCARASTMGTRELRQENAGFNSDELRICEGANQKPRQQQLSKTRCVFTNLSSELCFSSSPSLDGTARHRACSSRVQLYNTSPSSLSSSSDARTFIDETSSLDASSSQSMDGTATSVQQTTKGELPTPCTLSSSSSLSCPPTPPPLILSNKSSFVDLAASVAYSTPIPPSPHTVESCDATSFCSSASCTYGHTNRSHEHSGNTTHHGPFHGATLSGEVGGFRSTWNPAAATNMTSDHVWGPISTHPRKLMATPSPTDNEVDLLGRQVLSSDDEHGNFIQREEEDLWDIPSRNWEKSLPLDDLSLWPAPSHVALNTGSQDPETVDHAQIPFFRTLSLTPPPLNVFEQTVRDCSQSSNRNDLHRSSLVNHASVQI